MKVLSIEVKDLLPIESLKIEDLGDIVIIAGANGSGKTRLKNAIVNTLKGQPAISMTLESTRKEEETAFGGKTINVLQGQSNLVLGQYIKNRRFGNRAKYVGSLVQIDADRTVKTIKYEKANWFGGDPDDLETPIDWGYKSFTARWQDFMNYIHQKHASRDAKLANELKNNPQQHGAKILEKYPDPLDKYKKIFTDLLPGKELQPIEPSQPKEFYYKESGKDSLSFSSLSSGEQEVVKMLFDVASKDIKHSIIIVDEPELHLHPTLTFKLIESLKTIGENNQFIFLTHSADLISTYYSTGNVYFIASTQNGENQAHKLSDLDTTHKELTRLIGENLGLFAVGKMLIFVEGENSSIDRLTYHSIAQKYLSEAKIIPVGSVENIVKLGAFEKQIRNSIFGIELYMIRDRDGLTEKEIQNLGQNGRIKCLKKRHIENYFLDSEILFKVAKKLYITESEPRITQQFIEDKLKLIAKDLIKLNIVQNAKEHIRLNYNLDVPRVTHLENKSLEDIRQELMSTVNNSIQKLCTDTSNLETWINNEKIKLENALLTDSWKNIFRGKEIFQKFCGNILKVDQLKVRKAYIDIAIEEKNAVFKDIVDIFLSFRNT